MKALLLILILLCSIECSFGQVYIKGRIKDQQQSLSSATVDLLSADSIVLKSVATDSGGEFIFWNLLPGNYLVSSSVVGYSKFISQDISVEASNVILPDIILEVAATELNEVSIKAKKPLFEQQIDRLIVNVQGSITSSGSTILEVLEKSPGIIINKQDNSITMNGKSGVRVMMNGKIIQLPLSVVIQMLDGMSSANVEKLELITAPPAKYDADGSAGIIHIVTKKNTDFGTNGSFGLVLGSRWAETVGGNFSLNYRNQKVGLFLNYSVLRNHNLHLSKMNRQSKESGFTQTITDFSHRENITMQQNLNAGIEWKLTDNTFLNIGLAAYRSNWNMTAFTDDNNYAAIDSAIITHMNIRESNVWQSASAGMGLQTKLNSKNELSFNLDYLYYHNSNPSDYDDKLFYVQHNVNEFSKIDLKKTTPIRFAIAKADYQHFYSASLSLEAGIKVVTSNLNNNVLVRKLVNNVWITDPYFTSSSDLSEQIEAAYVSTKWQVLKQVQINSGLRYEYTHTSIGTPIQKDLINRKYGYLFPDISIKKEIDAKKDFQLSYSRRITRPTYNDIAPFVFFWGPNTFSAGNTSLYPATSDAIKAAYHVRQWIISLQWSHSKNEITFLQPEKDSQSDNLIYRSQNLKYLNTLGLSNSLSFRIANWWVVQSNLTTQYQTAQTAHLQNNSKLHLYGLNINLVNSLTLPKDYSFEVSGIYQSKTLTGVSNYLPVGSLNAGIQRKFGEKGTLKLAVDDILHTNYWKIKTFMPQNNLNSYFTYDFHDRFVRLTFTRNFGNNKLRSVKLKSGSEEERKRIAN